MSMFGVVVVVEVEVEVEEATPLLLFAATKNREFLYLTKVDVVVNISTCALWTDLSGRRRLQ